MTKAQQTQQTQQTQAAAAPDGGEAARRARFGTLPERIRPEDTVEERPATLPDPARDTYSDDDWLIHNVI